MSYFSNEISNLQSFEKILVWFEYYLKYTKDDHHKDSKIYLLTFLWLIIFLQSRTSLHEDARTRFIIYLREAGVSGLCRNIASATESEGFGLRQLKLECIGARCVEYIYKSW